MRVRITLVCLAWMLAAAVCPCVAGAQSGPTLTVYSSLPLRGPLAYQGRAIDNGARLAWEQSGGQAGAATIRYVSLHGPAAGASRWQAATRANARRVARDRSGIAYIGEYNSSSTIISLPILNRVGMPQVSPTNTYAGLTRRAPGNFRGDPQYYYPSGRRTYVRLVPSDPAEGRALAVLMKQRGCRRVFALGDDDPYGLGIVGGLRLAARAQGLRLIGRRSIRFRSNADIRSAARALRRARPECVAYAGYTPTGAIQGVKAAARALPRARLFVSDGLAATSFSDPRRGGVPASVAPRIALLGSVIPREAYPAPGQAFFAAYAARFGDASPDPYAVYGYEAMQLVLNAVASSGDYSRRGVLRQLFATRNRAGAIGDYSIDRNGDSTLARYPVLAISQGALVFTGAIVDGGG
jgi:branched-chain amino acid transport system substrate-binding protein